MTDAMAFWLREADVDGFRCDVAGMVPVDYWNEARPELEKIKEVFMLAEAPDPELMEHAFDMDYNWPMKDLFSAIAATSGQYTFKDKDGNVKTFPEKHAEDIYVRLEEEAAKYPGDSYMMNMITNHDLNSWEGTEFERLGNLQKAFAVLTYTLPGMPLIYTGQEVGLDRALEFFEKDNAPDWTTNQDVFEFYRTLNRLKHNRDDLNAGNGAKVERLVAASPDVIAFRRGGVLVAANLGNKALKPFKKAPSVKGMTDVFTGEAAQLPKTLQPGEFILFQD